MSPPKPVATWTEAKRVETDGQPTVYRADLIDVSGFQDDRPLVISTVVRPDGSVVFCTRNMTWWEHTTSRLSDWWASVLWRFGWRD